MNKIEKLIINGKLTVAEALKILDDTGFGILLLVDKEGRLVRTVTDGDIRRLLLNGILLEDNLSKLPKSQPHTIGEDDDPSQAIYKMNKFDIEHLPVLDKDGRPLSLLLRKYFDGPILLSSPHMSDFEMAYVRKAFETNWIAPLGPNVVAFEEDLANYVGGGSYVAALNTGTAALHLALCLLGIGQGDVVFCSSFTFVASANPILYVGAEPVFLDAEPESWNLSPLALEIAFEDARRIGKLPKAVIVANIYGQSADMDRILEICERYHVPIIEDAAESLGATYKGKKSGTFGKFGIFSFNGNKIITTSGGGALLSNDHDLIAKARYLSTQAREPVSHYEHKTVGYNYRLSNVLAGIGRGQLKVLDDRVAARRKIFECYARELADINEIEWMPEALYGASTRWLSACLLKSKKIDPEKFINCLAKKNIEARRVWKPMHMQTLFSKNRYFKHDENHSVSEELFEKGLCLPSGSNLTSYQQEKIIFAIKETIKSSVTARA